MVPPTADGQREVEASRHELLLEFAPDHFSGHFPDMPVLPGIVQLAAVERSAGEWLGLSSAAAVRQVRFRQRVGPGEPLRCELVGGPGEVGFRLNTRTGNLVSHGTLVMTTAELAAPTAVAPSTGLAAAEYPPVEQLLPHRGPALFLREVLSAGPEGIVCRGRIPAEHALARHGRVPLMAAIEFGAQAAAVPVELPEGGLVTPSGFLIGVKRVELLQAELPVETDVEVWLRSTGSAGALTVSQFSVWHDGAVVMRGAVSTTLT